MKRTHHATLSCVIATVVSLGAGVAAQKPPPGQLSLEEIAVMLSSPDADEMRLALESSALLGSADIVPMLEERVRAGLAPELLDTAMDALVLLAEPSAVPLFVELSRHRRPKVRARALQAIVALRGRARSDALLRGLSDSEAEVREAAARGLGELGDRKAIETLFRAFERDIPGASGSLGQLAQDQHVPRILAYLGEVPLTSLTPAIDMLVARPDLKNETRLMIVTRIAELGTPEARGYLEGLSKKIAPDTPARVRRAIAEAVARIAQ